jgi:four helix bundle protein
MIRAYRRKRPQIAASAYIDPAAVVIGDVVIGEDSSVWPCSVVRGDVHYIRIGARTNIQDGCVLHVMRDEYPLILGDNVTVGHSVTLHGCTIESRCLIGIGAILLNGVKIGAGSIIAAGTLLLEKTDVPAGSLVVGHPGKVKRALTPIDQAAIDAYAARYVEYKNIYREEEVASGEWRVASGERRTMNNSTKPKHYKDLLIWQKGMHLAKLVYKLTMKFPAEERYGLTSQLRRAAVSVPSNIAECQARSGTKEFLQFLSHAEGSLAELETQLLLSVELDFAPQNDVHASLQEIDELQKMIVALKRKLSSYSPLANRHSSLRRQESVQ